MKENDYDIPTLSALVLPDTFPQSVSRLERWMKTCGKNTAVKHKTGNAELQVSVHS